MASRMFQTLAAYSTCQLSTTSIINQSPALIRHQLYVDIGYKMMFHSSCKRQVVIAHQTHE